MKTFSLFKQFSVAILALGSLCLGLIASVALAENVDLSTVPSRDAVQLTIYNSEDLTLVRDVRKVTFKKGVNPLQFSWAGTLIDASSVELKFVTQVEKLAVVDTTFPHAKSQMLYWNVASEFDGEATIEISYFTSGISWSSDYVCIADKDEKTMSLTGYVRVVNNSGEEYENAQVRLVVGTINLVEKIAQLANKSYEDYSREHSALSLDFSQKVEKEAAMRWMAIPETRKKYSRIDLGSRDDKAKEIVKEGLSEYFIYTIEGTETIKNGWSKRMQSFAAEQVAFKTEYRYRPREYGDQLVRMYLLTNNEAAKLGTTPLPDGVVRLFRDNGKEGLTYLTQQQIKYVPIGDKIELNLGRDPEVVFELVKLRASRTDLWLQVNGVKELRLIGGDGVQKFENANLVGWNDHSVFTQRIRNYTAKPIEVEIRREIAGHIDFRSSLQPKAHDYQTVEFKAAIPAGKRQDLLFEIVQHQGTNAKQNNVTLQTAEVAK